MVFLLHFCVRRRSGLPCDRQVENVRIPGGSVSIMGIRAVYRETAGQTWRGTAQTPQTLRADKVLPRRPARSAGDTAMFHDNFPGERRRR